MAAKRASRWRENVAMWGIMLAALILGFPLAIYAHEHSPSLELIGVFVSLALAGLLGLTAWRVKKVRGVAGYSAFFLVLLSMFIAIFHGWENEVKVIYGLVSLAFSVVASVFIFRLTRSQSRMWNSIVDASTDQIAIPRNWPSEAALLATAQAPIMLYPRRSKVALYLAGQVPFVLVSAGFFFGSFIVVRDHGPGVFGILGMVLFGLCLLIFGGVGLPLVIYRLVTHRPAVTLTQLGIIDHASAIVTGAGPVPWDEVAASTIYRARRRLWFVRYSYLILIPRHPRALNGRVPRLTAFLSRFTAQIPAVVLPPSLATIHIPEWLLPISLEELQVQIENFIPDEPTDTHEAEDDELR